MKPYTNKVIDAHNFNTQTTRKKQSKTPKKSIRRAGLKSSVRFKMKIQAQQDQTSGE